MMSSEIGSDENASLGSINRHHAKLQECVGEKKRNKEKIAECEATNSELQRQFLVQQDVENRRLILALIETNNGTIKDLEGANAALDGKIESLEREIEKLALEKLKKASASWVLGGRGSANASGASVSRNECYLTGNYIDRNGYLERLLGQLDTWMSSPEWYYHSTALVNSSGMGKSRVAKEICRHRRAVCVSLSSNNVPIHSPELCALFLSLAAKQGLERTKQAKKLLASIMQAADGLDVDTLYNSQFSEDTSILTFVDNVCDQLQLNTTVQRVRREKIKEMKSEVAHHIPSVSFPDDKVPTVSERSRLLIIIDEAMLLLDKDDERNNQEFDENNVIRTLRRVASRIQGCYLLFVSTSSCAQHLAPTRPPDVEWKVFPPLFEVGDCYHYANQKVSFPFNLGRPLWGMLCQSDGSGLDYVLDVQARLMGGEKSTPRLSLLASFMSRFWLKARKSTGNFLTQHHLAIVGDVAIDADGEVGLTSYYFSEPIVAEASALSLFCRSPGLNRSLVDQQLDMTSVGERMKSVLAAVNKALLQGELLSDKGEIGEVCGAALLAFSMDVVRFEVLLECKLKNYDLVNRSFSSPLSMQIFLERVLRSYNNEPDWAEGLADFSGFSIQCTHFVAWHSLETSLGGKKYLPWEQLYCMFVQRAALFTRVNYADIFVIPIFDTNGSPGVMLVQVKNQAHEIKVTDGQSLLAAMRPTAIVEENVPCVCLLLAVGNGCQPYFARLDNHSHDLLCQPEERLPKFPRLEATLCNADFLDFFPKDVVDMIGHICVGDWSRRVSPRFSDDSVNHCVQEPQVKSCWRINRIC